MTGRRRKKAAVLFFFCLCMGIASCGNPTFVVYNKSRDEVVYRVPSGKVELLVYTYRQSYDRGIIEEFFVIRDGKLVPTKMTYDTDSYDYHGSRYTRAERTLIDNRWHITIEEHEGYPEISYRVGYTIEQELQVITDEEEHSFRFNRIGNPGDLLVVGETTR